MKISNILKVIPGICLVLIVSVLTACASFGSSGYTYYDSDSSRGSGDTTGSSSAAAVQRIPQGTYTFYPRLRAHEGGVDKSAYIDRVEVKDNSVVIYLIDRPLGKGTRPDSSYGWAGMYSEGVVLQDLDRPSRTYNVTNRGTDEVTGGDYIVFQNVTGTRFSLTQTRANPPAVFDEIILDTPDVDLGLQPLKNGTYTFYPRLRAHEGGVDRNSYIDRITVRSGYLTVYLIDRPSGRGNRSDISYGWSGMYSDGVILQNLDHPQFVYNVINRGTDEVTGGEYIVFQNVTATRFSLTQTRANPPTVFEEIILGEPDS